jgi:hypothetical protein
MGEMGVSRVRPCGGGSEVREQGLALKVRCRRCLGRGRRARQGRKALAACTGQEETEPLREQQRHKVEKPSSKGGEGTE